MIAIKWDSKKSTAIDGKYPKKIIRGCFTLPRGYDELITDEQYNQIMSENSTKIAQYNANEKARIEDEEKARLKGVGAEKFELVRKKWQSMADSFAFDNVGKGIDTDVATQIALSFKDVKYLLDSNVPMGAVKAIDSVPTNEFLTVEVRDAMKQELLTYIVSIFEIGS